MAIMLDPSFKVVVPVLMLCFDQLNPIASTSTIAAVDVVQ
jgi:hypothetical protein